MKYQLKEQARNRKHLQIKYLRDAIRKNKMTVDEGNTLLINIGAFENQNMINSIVDLNNQSKQIFVKQLEVIHEQN